MQKTFYLLGIVATVYGKNTHACVQTVRCFHHVTRTDAGIRYLGTLATEALREEGIGGTDITEKNGKKDL